MRSLAKIRVRTLGYVVASVLLIVSLYLSSSASISARATANSLSNSSAEKRLILCDALGHIRKAVSGGQQYTKDNPIPITPETPTDIAGILKFVNERSGRSTQRVLAEIALADINCKKTG